MIKALLTVLFLLATLLPAWADTGLGSGMTPIRRSFAQPVVLPANQELVIAGTNPSDRTVTMVLRLDDGASNDYASRVNDERVLPPGPFVLRFPTSGLRTPSGRTLNHEDLRRLFIVVAAGNPEIMVDRITVEQGFTLPPGVIALDFGAPEAPVFPGFESVNPGDPRIASRIVRPVRRPGPDILIGDGLVGVEKFEMAVKAGRWRVSMWVEDPGEWEFVPHPIERRIRLNGKNILFERYTGETWMRDRYLAGGNAEAIADGDAWAVFGERRGRLLEAETDAPDGRIVIEMAGDRADSTFISALVAEPVGGRAREEVQAARAQRFRETWRLEPIPPTEPVPDLVFGAAPVERLTPAHRPASPMLRAEAAPGTAVRFDLLAVSPAAVAAPEIIVDVPVNGSVRLPARIWVGQWQYERPSTSATLLRASPGRLRADVQALGLKPNLPRRYMLRVEVPEGTPPGRYEGLVSLRAGSRTAHAALSVDVVAAKLPPVDVPIGIYLDMLPAYSWFADFRAARQEALSCDLRFLRSLGLTGIAPPLVTPFADAVTSFINDVSTAEAAGFLPPILAYAPAKRLIERSGIASASTLIADAERRLREAGLAGLAWSIADEPSNPGGAAQRLADMEKTIHAAVPSAKLAGHLNAREDEKYLKTLNIALINAGFGADGADIRRVRAAGVSPWFYNMGSYRLAAGFYFWRVGPDGYLQWHGRMPTADPFDPTDGREADVQLLFPSPKACPPVPDIHAELLELAEGLIDLRWLKWLDRAAARDARAERLRARLLREIPDSWKEARRLDAARLNLLRQEIVALARTLEPTP